MTNGKEKNIEKTFFAQMRETEKVKRKVNDFKFIISIPIYILILRFIDVKGNEVCILFF